MEELSGGWIVLSIVLLILGPPGAMWALVEKKFAGLIQANLSVQETVKTMNSTWNDALEAQQEQWDREREATQRAAEEFRTDTREWLKSVAKESGDNAKHIAVLLDRIKR